MGAYSSAKRGEDWRSDSYTWRGRKERGEGGREGGREGRRETGMEGGSESIDFISMCFSVPEI